MGRETDHAQAEPAAPEGLERATQPTRLPESAEQFEHVLRRLVIAKEKAREVPPAPVR